MADPVAYHVIFCTYGFWLPNDPRGSRSSKVWATRLRPFGRATKTAETESVAAVPHNWEVRQIAKEALKYPAVFFNGNQAWSVAKGFGLQTEKSGYVIYACAILPGHVHLVIRHHRYSIKQVVRLLKQSATTQLLTDDRHPFADLRNEKGELPTVWAEECWKTCLDTEEEVCQAIIYVEENPVKEGKRRQRWSFVTPFSEGDGPVSHTS